MTDLKRFMPIGLAVLFTMPGLAMSLLHLAPAPPFMALTTGAAILGASFLLLWACDAAQKDISQALALAVVALIAVLPEYAVDMYFTWQAGQHPESDYAHYAIANMTGANRLLIGVAWSVIIAIFWLKSRRAIELDPDRRTEILFLGLATLYAFVIPIKGSLAWLDGVALIGLYIWYIRLASRRPCETCELDGPAELLGRLHKGKRRAATALMFLFAAGVILANAEVFCESLIATGRILGVSEFLLVQWLAPIASEAPEFTVAIMLALRDHAAVALGSLLSAKLNQWTLLVGMIPGVYGLSSGSLANPIPMGAMQMNEILLTAAQSLLAVALLVGLRIDLKGALLLLALFVGQFLAPFTLSLLPQPLLLQVNAETVHLAFSALYIITSVAFLLRNRTAIPSLFEGLKIPGTESGIPAGLVLAESPSHPKALPREAALERSSSRSN